MALQVAGLGIDARQNGLIETIEVTLMEHRGREFILHPGADPGDIIMQHRGMISIQNDQNSGIEINSSLGKIIYNKLSSYNHDSKEQVACAFRLKGDQLRFEMNAPKSETVVIDPNIIWGTYFGGPKNESNSFDLIIDGNSNGTATCDLGAYEYLPPLYLPMIRR
jgi:hypothetical protein